jgi:uncharacterized membrane protein HdeD (DUF308 family)
MYDATETRPPTGSAWWAGLLRGILAIIFGAIALIFPGITLEALVLVFGVYAIVDGIIEIVRGVHHRGSEHGWGWWILLGLVSIIAGLVAFFWPGITAVALLYVIAVYFIIGGILAVITGFRLRPLRRGGWVWFIVGGVLASIFGVLLVIFPGAGILDIVWILGLYAIVFGILMIISAFQFKHQLDEFKRQY